MFAKTKKPSKYGYVYTVRDYRRWGKLHRETIASMASLNKYREGLDLKKLAHSLTCLYERLKTYYAKTE